MWDLDSRSAALGTVASNAKNWDTSESKTTDRNRPPRASKSSQLNNAASHGHGDGLGAIFSPKLVHNVLNMNFDRFLRNAKRVSDVPIPISFCYVSQDLDLANGQIVIAHVLGQMGGYFGRHPFFARVYVPDDIYRFAWRHALKKVSPSPSLQGALDFNVAFEGCEHDNPGILEFRPDCDDNINSTQIWKPKIHERHVRSVFPILAEPLRSIGGL